MQYKNLVLIGTSHIAQQSVDAINSAFLEYNPGIVAVELDKVRLQSLVENKKTEKVRLKDIRSIGVGGFIFAVLGSYMQRKLGNSVGIDPGKDMLTAVKLAHGKKLPIFLVDQDIRITLKRLSKAIGFREVCRFIGDLFRGLFFKKSELKRYGLDSLDLKKVPEDKVIARMILELKKRYPALHRVLVEERNEYMASRLAKIMAMHPDTTILAVVGAGHGKELMLLVKKKQIEIVRK